MRQEEEALTSREIDADNICTVSWLVIRGNISEGESIQASFSGDGVVYSGDR